jgi:hypothetical protein
MLEHQIADLPHDAAALGCGELFPRPVLKCGAGGFHGAVDVLGLALGALGDDRAVGGIAGGEGLAAGRWHPPAPDEQLAGALDEGRV